VELILDLCDKLLVLKIFFGTNKKNDRIPIWIISIFPKRLFFIRIFAFAKRSILTD